MLKASRRIDWLLPSIPTLGSKKSKAKTQHTAPKSQKKAA